jgi:hypothetical protein
VVGSEMPERTPRCHQRSHGRACAPGAGECVCGFDRSEDDMCLAKGAKGREGGGASWAIFFRPFGRGCACESTVLVQV